MSGDIPPATAPGGQGCQADSAFPGAPLSASPVAEAWRLTAEGSHGREPDPEQVSLVAYVEISLNSNKNNNDNNNNDVAPIYPVSCTRPRAQYCCRLIKLVIASVIGHLPCARSQVPGQALSVGDFISRIGSTLFLLSIIVPFYG